MKDVPEHEWLYAVKEDGRVWSYKSWMFLKPYKNPKTWYICVSLSKNWNHRPHTMHVLVATCCLPNPNNYPIVRHFDNNPENNHVSNLEWCTYGTNLKQAYDDGLRVPWKPVMQLTKEWILCRVYKSITEAAKINHLPICNISQCALWHRSTAWGYGWKYL